MNKHDLACAIADNGGWEEFHQKRRNSYMQDYHKAQRLKLEAEYRERFAKMNGYVCFYNGKSTEVTANTTLEARDKAALFWKVPKKKEYLISALLAEKDGKQVYQSTASI